MGKPSQQQKNLITFAIRIGLSLIVIIIADTLAVEALHEIKNDYLQALVAIVLLAINGTHIHFVLQAIRNIDIVSKKLRETHSGACHFCNADPRHCFKMNGKRLPICARHLGFYGSLFVLGVSLVIGFDNWIYFINNISWKYHFIFFIICLCIVIIEGGLGKAKVIKVRNWVRFSNGIMSTMIVLFFATFMLSIFQLTAQFH